MTDPNLLLQEITALSHEFGTPDHVKGGGGNTSFKDGQTVWVKPSGTTLADLRPENFVAVDRRKLAALYEMEVPPDSAEREARVKDLMMRAVCGGSRGRPSVETPLHDILEAPFVVHTHTTLVNGLTCSREGRAAAARIFPDALWVPYTDPGFTLSMIVRRMVGAYREARGRQPTVILLENHGVFVAGRTPEEIRAIYADILEKVSANYRRADISMYLKEEPPQPTAAEERAIRELLGRDAAEVVAAPAFAVAEGPLTPDHIVYARAIPFTGPLRRERVEAFVRDHGYPPRVVATGSSVYGIGRSRIAAQRALDLARDGGLVRQLAQAFGGVQYMTRDARRFIETWEVESYREQQIKT